MMRRKIYFLIPLLLFTLFLTGEDGRITVEVTGIKKIAGHMIISLYDKPDGFPNTKNTKETVYVRVETKTVTHVFPHLPPGDYALAVIHDVNSNKKLDKYFFGLPKEKYGFSRNAKGFLGPPSFKKAKFTLKETYLARIKI
jgi:uncharacterized protein (DUF2141 family)